MKPKLYQTVTGEYTLYIEALDETYHSRDGAISESKHVFIENGLNHFLVKDTKCIDILEVGFGTGLNALLTCLEAEKIQKNISYTGVEAFPLHKDIIKELNYSSFINEVKAESLYHSIHDARWNETKAITAFFTLYKLHQKIQDVQLEENQYNLIYFDAFAPKKQSELWELELLKKLHLSLKTGGLFVTYAAAGQLKRNLRELEFEVHNPRGANGKREMTVARKL